MVSGGHPPAPLLVAATVDRQRRVDVARADRDQPAREHADVLVVDVERVERLRGLARGADELVHVVDETVREVVVEEQIERVTAVARSLARDRHQSAVHARIPDHRPVHGAVEGELLAAQAAGVEQLHRPAAAFVQVADPAMPAQRLDVRVDDVEAGRRERPRGVLATPDEDVAGEVGRHRAALVNAGAVQLHLLHEPGVVEADLRAGDHQRVVGRRARAGDHQGVARLRAVPRRRQAGVARGEAPRVKDHIALRAPGRRLEVSLAGQARGGLGIVGLAEVLPHRIPAVLAEPALEGGQELRSRGLLAPALADELSLERVERVDVVAREVGHVREQAERMAMTVDVPVDPLDVDVDVVQDLAALAAVAQQHLRLVRQRGLRLRARLERLEADDQVERALPRRVDRRQPRVVARLLQQRRSVLGDHPAGTPGHVVLGDSVNVRGVVHVPDDRHARVRHRFRRERAGRRVADRVRLEVLAQLRLVHVAEQRRQRVVHPRLPVGARRRRDRPVLTRRQNVQRNRGVVLRHAPARGGADRSQTGPQGETRRGQRNDEHDQLLTHGASFLRQPNRSLPRRPARYSIHLVRCAGRAGPGRTGLPGQLGSHVRRIRAREPPRPAAGQSETTPAGGWSCYWHRYAGTRATTRVAAWPRAACRRPRVPGRGSHGCWPTRLPRMLAHAAPAASRQ